MLVASVIELPCCHELLSSIVFENCVCARMSTEGRPSGRNSEHLTDGSSSSVPMFNILIASRSSGDTKLLS